MNTKQDIQNRLQQAGIKPSLQRMAVMEYLVKHPIHPTVDMIFGALSPSIPTLSRTTVYNTVKLLEEQNVIQMITIDEKNARFDADKSVHAHFQCKKCGKIEDMFISALEPHVAQQFEHLQIIEGQAYYKGYCAKCRNDRV